MTGVRIEQDARLGRELVIAGPQQNCHRQARERLEAKAGVRQVERLAAQRRRGIPEPGDVCAEFLRDLPLRVPGERLRVEQPIGQLAKRQPAVGRWRPIGGEQIVHQHDGDRHVRRLAGSLHHGLTVGMG